MKFSQAGVAFLRRLRRLGGVGAHRIKIQLAKHEPRENGFPEAFFFHDPFISSFVVVFVLVK